MLTHPKTPCDATRRVFSRSLLLGVLLTGVVQHQASAFEIAGTATLPLDAPTASVNTLDVGLRALGVTEVDTMTIFGIETVIIDSSDTTTSTISGSLLCDFDLEIDPGTFAAQINSISFRESPISLDQDPNLILSLGTILGFVELGTVEVTGQNLIATAETPFLPGTVTGTTFPLSPHDLRLYSGTIIGTPTGLAAGNVDPINVDLTTTPLVGPLGTGNGTVTISAPTVIGSMLSYDVVVTAPADFSALVTNDPVDVTVTTTGTVTARGTLMVEIPAMGPIEVLSVAAGSPGVNDVTLTWDSNGGAGTYRVLSSLDLLTPIASWTVENPSVGNAGATTSFTDSGILLSDDTKYYVIEEN